MDHPGAAVVDGQANLQPAAAIANPAADLRDRPLSMKTKLAFAVGTTGEAIAIFSVSAYAMLFYNQVLGLPAYLAGIAMSLSLILDGPCDLLMGSISDRTRSRFGRRHLYMYISPLPIALGLLAVFNPPRGLPEAWLFGWFLVSVVFLRQVMNVFHTPHFALGGELSRDYTERSKVMAYASFSQAVGATAMAWVALSFFFRATPRYPSGLLNPAPWAAFSIAVAAAVFVMLYASAWYTRDRIALLPKAPDDLPRFGVREFYRDVSKAFSNRNYVILIAGYFLLTMMVGLRTGLSVYTNTFFWGLKSDQLRWIAFSTLLGYGVAFCMTATLHAWFDKKPTIVVSAIVQAIAPSVPILLSLMGLLSDRTPALVPILVAALTVGSMAGGVLTMSVTSAMADIVDENDLKYGVRQEGVMYAMRNLFGKVDQAVGAVLAGVVLTVIHFPAKAQVGHLAHRVVLNLALCDGLWAAVPGLLAILPYLAYRITRRSYDTTKSALAARGLVR
jgi:GPH family glycoside/pentoside/hexuronide:cation symporter